MRSRGRPAPFLPLIHGVRWGALAAGLAVASVRGPLARSVVLWGIVLVVYGAWRTVRPLDLQVSDASRRFFVLAGIFPFLLEVTLASWAIVSTGYWESPFAFCILTPVMAAGFSRGYAFAVRLAVAAYVAVSLPSYLTDAAPSGQGLQWIIELLLVAVLAGYARRVFGEAEQRHSQTLDRMAQLSEANELLVSLHRVAQQLPASLDLETVLASTASRLRSLIESDVTAVLLRDDVNAGWTVAAGEGIQIGWSFADDELPPAVASAITSSVASLVVCLEPGEGMGPDVLSHTALYAPLRARGALIGVVALEHHAPGFYGRRELQLLDTFIEPTALTIDNARWFARLRAIGADEERVRIARDMHDRLGQTLAGVAFGLDRIHRQVTEESLREELDGLRGEVRVALGEMREALGDLRTDVTDERSLIDTMTAFLERVEGRAGLEVNFTHQNGTRLPLVQERELWRIAQEAITNVERHAHARHLSVRWEYDGKKTLLAVADDGEGFAPRRLARADSYGITGMRERADAIGASLDIDSAPGGGTVVRCQLAQR
ncbi:MAG: GAF domain-containing sensor histidine kinase [Actinobacteria bacterium]|nr:GAF domain-containing sensor histidine kinase [Actinomycetota bacterium]